MGSLTYSIPTAGNTPNSIADPMIATALTTLLNWGNGGIDVVNLSAALQQSAGLNQGSQISKGASIIPTTGTRTNTAYGALSDGPDQVANVVLPGPGLLEVWYHATWQESVSGAGRAAIYLGANQQQAPGSSGPVTVAAATNSGTAATDLPLFTLPTGLASISSASAYAGDVTTGQALGYASSGVNVVQEGASTLRVVGFPMAVGGPCHIFAAAGTYTLAVEFKASSGTVTAKNRRLYVQAMSFA